MVLGWISYVVVQQKNPLPFLGDFGHTTKVSFPLGKSTVGWVTSRASVLHAVTWQGWSCISAMSPWALLDCPGQERQSWGAEHHLFWVSTCKIHMVTAHQTELVVWLLLRESVASNPVSVVLGEMRIIIQNWVSMTCTERHFSPFVLRETQGTYLLCGIFANTMIMMMKVWTRHLEGRDGARRLGTPHTWQVLALGKGLNAALLGK